jgi:hypothetical protein
VFLNTWQAYLWHNVASLDLWDINEACMKEIQRYCCYLVYRPRTNGVGGYEAEEFYENLAVSSRCTIAEFYGAVCKGISDGIVFRCPSSISFSSGAQRMDEVTASLACKTF